MIKYSYNYILNMEGEVLQVYLFKVECVSSVDVLIKPIRTLNIEDYT